MRWPSKVNQCQVNNSKIPSWRTCFYEFLISEGFFETLRIRRQSSCKEIKDDSMDAKILATGPEFFLNANQGPKVIDITTPKVIHFQFLRGKCKIYILYIFF
jgi:hypothetical protein